MRRHFFMGSGRFAAAAAGVAAPTLTGSPTLLASWDFDNASTVTLSGSDIDSIAGADGTSYTLLTPGAMPTQETRSSKKTARFTSASSQYMQIASACGVLAANGCTQVAIAESATTNYNGAVVENGVRTSGATADRVITMFRSAAEGVGVRRMGNASNRASAFTAKLYLMIGTHPSGTAASTSYMDGEATGVSTTSNVFTATALTHTTLGASAASSSESSFFNGWLWRVLIYQGVLSATQLEEVAVWAAANYGTTNNA